MESRPDSTSAAAQHVEEGLVGQRVHKYQIVRSIGRGGMGMVYEAVNTTIGKRVAMKFVDADLARNKEAVARFHREAQAASAVESAHIVEIFDSGFTDDETPFLVMELLRGEDLGHRIKRCGRIELAEALHVTAQILRGLHRAHEAGIVHRDLKPDNIFLVDRDDDPNFAKILDFGISKVQRAGVPAHTLTREGTVLGTPFYMSPEQAQAMPDVDGRTDIWAVGAILYECLAGHPPHSGTTYEAVIVNICMKDAQDVRMSNPAVPEPVARVIAKALARERVDRFSTAREFLDALVAAAGGMIASWPGRISGDELAQGATSSSPKPGRTPRQLTPAGEALGFEPTLEVNSGSSKVGWSTSRRAAGARPQRRALIALAALSLLIGLIGAFFYARRTAVDTQETTVTVELRANAAGARFSVDGVALADRTLRGHGGETKRLRVEAAGYMPIDKDITLQPSSGPLDVVLEPVPTAAPPPQLQPAAASIDTAAVAVVDTPKPLPTSTKRFKVATPGKAPASSKQPAPPLPAPPKPTGVAGGLQLKVD